MELLHPVHVSFILLVTHRQESWHCTPRLYQLTDLGGRVEQMFFPLSVYCDQTGEGETVYFKFVFRSCAQVGGGGILKILSASCSRKRMGGAF